MNDVEVREGVDRSEVGTVQTREVYVRPHGDVLISKMSDVQLINAIKEKQDEIKALETALGEGAYLEAKKAALTETITALSAALNSRV